MRAVFVYCLISVTTNAAPQENRFGFGDIMNGLKEAVSGKEYDTPAYRVIATHVTSDGEFEEREYDGDKYWACNKRVITPESGDGGMFMTLFRYITGANEGGNKISMTSPVSMHMTSKNPQDNSFTKAMCFYLDKSHQANPPQPTNTEVYLEKRPPMTVYTRKVGGYMSNEDWFTESQNLDKMISEKGFETEQGYFFANGYDSPMKFWNRRNEVWKVKKA